MRGRVDTEAHLRPRVIPERDNPETRQPTRSAKGPEMAVPSRASTLWPPAPSDAGLQAYVKGHRRDGEPDFR